MVSVGAFMFARDAVDLLGGQGGDDVVHPVDGRRVRAFGIRVNALAPGPVDTDMMRGNPPEVVVGMVGATLMKRLATPDEMVGPALLLCSDAGSYITGTVVIVDGGGTPR